MKSFARFLVGTTALVVFSSVAYSADMDPLAPPPPGAPVAGLAFEPPPPVASCKDKKGYYIVPNTTTCLKLNGMIRAQIYVHEDNIASDHWTGDDFGSIENTTTTNDTWTMGTAARFGADTVTQTDYGTLRGNILLQADAAANGSAGPVGIRYAFIEWQGITAGHTDSFFAPSGAPAGFGGAVGDYGNYRRTLLGYKAEFTKEVSAGISIEDHDFVDGGDGVGSPVADLVKSSDILLAPVKVHNDGTQLPDLVGNVVGKFDWGLLFASGAVGRYRTIEVVTKNRDDFTGWAVGAGGELNLDALSKGDMLQAKVGYADGATAYIGSSGDAAIIDTVGPDYASYTTTGWTAQGSFLHNWSPTWSSFAYAGYAAAERTTSADATVLALVNDTVSSAWGVGANLQWEPVESLTMGGEVFYTSVTKENLATGDYTADAIGSVFRMQRAF